MTPYDKLKSLPSAAQYLKRDMRFESLDELAYAISDNEAAKRLQHARYSLCATIDERMKVS